MAYLVRILKHPDDRLTIIHPAMNDTARPLAMTDADWAFQLLNKTLEKNPQWQGLPSVDIMNDTLPNKMNRYAWRLVDKQVVVDLTVPSPDPQAELRSKLNAANTIAELKLVLKEALNL